MITNKELIKRSLQHVDELPNQSYKSIILGCCSGSREALSKQAHQILTEFCIIQDKVEAEFNGYYFNKRGNTYG